MAQFVQWGLVCTRSEMEELLREDAPFGDLTTSALGISDARCRMAFEARERMTAALVEDAAALVQLAGGHVDLLARSGQPLEPGEPILTAEGSAAALFKAWKVAQTLIETWSGVASCAGEIVAAARAVDARTVVACTRKSTPGTRRYAVAAVQAGGAVMHRLGLSETILVFAEHLGLTAGAPLDVVVERLRGAAPEKKLTVEVVSLDEGLRAAAAGFDVIQAEKFTPVALAELAARTARLPTRPLIAAAGGIHAGNAADYARAGADVLVTSAPYWARPRDVQVRIAPA